MKYPVIAFTRLLGAVALSTLIVACGSSGGDDDDAAGGGLVDTSVDFRVTCTVTDSLAKTPVQDALVTFKIDGIDPSATSTRTGPDGKCAPLDIKAANVTGLTQVAASVVKDNYEPAQFTCAITFGGTPCVGTVDLVPLATNTSLPENGDVVTHLGDNTFDGTINSKFQSATVGLSADFPIAKEDWGDKLQANPSWTRATVVLDAKGWQTTIAPNCKNTITIIGGVGSQSQPGGNSDINGEWSSSTFDFDVAQIGRTGPATLRLVSGLCSTDYDDFEINRIRVYYCDASAGVSCAPKP
jgi:hypothetical protein